MRRSFTAILALPLAVILASCATPHEHQPERVTTMWSIPANIFGEPVISGDTIVAYTHDDTQLRIAAWDLETGDELWSADALPLTRRGQTLTPTVVTLDEVRYTAYLAPVPDLDGAANLYAVDITTGDTTEAKGRLRTFNSQIRACDAVFCFDGQFGDVNAIRELQFNPHTGITKPAADTITFIDALRLSGNLVVTDATEDGSEHLQMMEGNQVLWSRAYSEIFGEGASIGYGYRWWVTDKDPIVGFGYAPSTGDSADDVFDVDAVDSDATHVSVSDLSDIATRTAVGLDAETGETVWSVPGATSCDDYYDTDHTAAVVPLCRFNSGTETITWRNDDTFTTELTDATLEVLGVAPSTGEIVWETTLHDVVASDEVHNYRAGSAQLAILTTEGIRTVDVETGTVRTPAAHEHFGCLHRQYTQLSLAAHDTTALFNAGITAQSCDRLGLPGDILTPLVIEAVGTEASNGRWVFATPDGLTAVRIAPAETFF